MLGEVVAELVTGLVEGFAELLAGEGLPPGITSGGVCQLWVEARYLAGAVGGLTWPALAQALQQLEAALARCLRAAIDRVAAGQVGQEELAQLQAWCSAPTARGTALAQACVAQVQEVCAEELAASAANLVPLQLLGRSGGAPPRQPA